MKNTSIRFRFFSLFLFLFYTHVHAATTWTVTSNADTGAGTLRNILAAGTTVAGDIINFSGPMTITIGSTITISKSVTIDATTAATGWSAGHNKVTIVGTGTGSVNNGLQLSATGISMKGITFQNFASNCIFVSGAPNFRIKSCFFNTDTSGTVANPSTISQAVGMYVNGTSSGGIIGGPNAGDGNVFYTALTNGTCIHLYNISGMTASTKIFVQGNKFGTDYTGTVNLGLGTNCSAIQCAFMSYVQIGGLGVGEGNQFDGSASGGKSIYLYGTSGATEISILGNKIGTVAANSNSYGIVLGTGTYTTITIQKNTISNSANYGIDMTGATLSSVKLSQNLFSNNTTGAINNTITAPAITSVNTGKIVGTGAGNGGFVEIYKWDGLQSTQGSTYIGSATADASGNWSSQAFSFTLGDKITATTTLAVAPNSTSKFSASATVVACTTAVNAGLDQVACATSSSVSFSGSSGGTSPLWTIVNGLGSLSSPNTYSTNYIPSAAEQASASSITVTLKLTVNTSTCATTISDQVTLTIAPKPTASAGSNQNFCSNGSGVALSGAVTNGSGAWSGGLGTFSPDANTLTATYIPSSGERTAGNPISLTLTSTGFGSCMFATATSTMVISFIAAATANAGNDRSVCLSNPNVIVNGTITGATGSTWTTAGTGTFANPNNLTTTYDPSPSDKTAGSVTLTLTTTGGCAGVSDAVVLTFTTCRISPKLTFDTQNLSKPNESDPFKHGYTTNSAGAITYTILKASDLTATSCATIDANGFITLTCVDVLRVTAYQAAKGVYDADTAYFTLNVEKAVTRIKLETRGGVVSDTFRLQVKTNYDQALTYSIDGGDVGAISISSNGLITGLSVGAVYVSAHAAGDANYQSANSNIVLVNIYPNLTPPVAVNDTLHMSIGETKTINLADNDYGTTASINFSPMNIDIDSENPGVQDKFFRPGIGIFTIDAAGLLTFSAFQAFIGVDSIQYTIKDADSLVSNKASFVFYVASPVAEIAMKANEIITANGDNLNNALVIGYTDLTQSNDLLIVDAAGNKLYYEKNYQNNWSATDSSGNNLGNGVYYYIFREFDVVGAVRRQLKGNFTVIR